MKEYVQLLKMNPCQDCDLFFPYYVMDFDHHAHCTKSGDISRIMSQGSWTKLEEEIEKCDFVCANCHRVRTHDRAYFEPKNRVLPLSI